MENKEKSRFSKKQWLLIIDAAITLIIVLVAIILLRFKPAEYNAQPSKQEISPYITNSLIPQFYNGIQTGKPFEIAIEQKSINEAISSFGWPQIYNNVIISTPAVSFVDDVVRIVCMVSYNGMDMVFSIEINPQFNEKGELNLQIERAKIGAMSVTFVVKQVAKRMFNEQAGPAEPDNIVYSAMASLMRDEPFEPVFKLQNNQVKVDSIEVNEGRLKVHFVPVEELQN